MTIKWSNDLLNIATQNILEFYTGKGSLINAIKIVLVLEELKVFGTNKKFSTVEHLNSCLRAAGWKYASQAGEGKIHIENNAWTGEDRLKNIVQMLDQMEF